MSKRAPKPVVQLPKDALSRINLGHAFAEYDKTLNNPYAFVQTPAMKAAIDASWSKCFFVGRRGAGKTAITYYLQDRWPKTTIQIFPQIFSSLGNLIEIDRLREPGQRQFRSLVSCFKRALLDEVLIEWNRRLFFTYKEYDQVLSRERNLIENFDFDLRMVTLVEDTFSFLKQGNEKDWIRQIKRPTEIERQMEERKGSPTWDFTILIDRVDDYWDGSDEAVVLLMALMHACIELCSSEGCIRPLLFLRENIFERVREIDNEFARLETFVVSLNWSQEWLLEMIERRLNIPFHTKISLDGSTWNYFFEEIDGRPSYEYIFEYCQNQPRNVLIYCSFAIESAQSKKHGKILIEDFQISRRRFSDSRLKDLGDEYAENFPQIKLILDRFYGLGREFTITGIEAFIQKLLLDDEVRQYCQKWIYNYTTADRFIGLMYNIGFFGIKEKDDVKFRTIGPQSSTPPSINRSTNVIIHPSYTDALNLQNFVIGALDKTVLQTSGILNDLPDAINLDEYQEKLKNLLEELKTLPPGDAYAGKYEELVGETIRLCFYRSLTNVESRVRDVEGRVIRDWIVANRAVNGFWEMIRSRYQATQVVWECKNYVDLGADVWHQCGYYMTKEIGYFSVLCFRGDEIKKHYYEHVQRIARQKEGGVVLILMDKDLAVFIRQAMNGKIKEDHIQDLFDRTVRMIS